MNNSRRVATLNFLLLATLPLLLVWPQPGVTANALDQLLQQVRQERSAERTENQQRERRFAQARDQQQALLARAKQALANEDARGVALRQQYQLMQEEIQAKTEFLEQNQGAVGELHGIVRQISSETKGNLEGAYVSAQFPERIPFLAKLSESKEMPSFENLQRFWDLLMEEMVESGKVTQFNAKTITADGDERQQQVTRVGEFNALADGQFLRYLPETGRLIIPSRQPPPRLQKAARRFENASQGIHSIPIDPTRGTLLSLLVQKPTLMERIRQGGVVGYIIILLGILGIALAIYRFVVLSGISRKIRDQLANKTPNLKNPLGRLKAAFAENPGVDTETIGLKLDEAVLRELPGLQKGLSTLAILAAVAPLLGLLGTVTGIIETFQSITLFGTGDPRIMSGGISQALVTTVLGLTVAIPILLLHSFLSSNSNRLIQILDEQSASMMAHRAEQVPV